MTARTGMANLITELRGLTEAGTADYTVTSSTYWSDDHLQDVLDNHRRDVVFAPLAALPTVVAGGSLSYKEYRAAYDFLEATTGGTDVFYLQDSTGATFGTSLWSADYRRGVITFASNTLGSYVYMTGRSYDLNAAAADVWQRKTAHFAPGAFDFSTDNHSINRSQVYSHCLEMVQHFTNMSRNAIQTVSTFRSDLE